MRRAQLGNAAFGIIERLRLDTDLAGDHTCAAMIERARIDFHRAVRRDPAAVAGKVAGTNGKNAGGRMLHFAVDVQQRFGRQTEIIGIDGNAPARIVQDACRRTHTDGAIAGAGLDDGALAVIQVGRMHRQLAGTRLAHAVNPALAILRARIDCQRTRCTDDRAAGRYVTAIGGERDIGGARLAAADIHRSTGEYGIAGRQILPPGEQLLGGGDVQVGRIGQRAVRLDTRSQQTRRSLATEAGSVYIRIAQGRDHA